MSNYKYCDNDRCMEAIKDGPTTRQVIEDDYSCPHCGASNDPLKSVKDVFMELVERVEAIEARMDR